MRRFLKWGIRISVGFVLLIAVALVAVRLYLTDARLTTIARDQLSKHVPFPVGFSGVELSLLHGIVLRDLDVGPPNAAYQKHVFTAKEVRVGYKLGPLVDKRMEIDTICLIEPHATLEQVDGKWNVVALGEAFPADPNAPPKPKDDGPPADLPVEITLDRFCVDNFTADVFSPAMTAHVDHLYVEARGGYRGLTSVHGEVEVDLGRADSRSTIDFSQQGLGEAHLQSTSRLTAKLADMNHVQATWDFLFDQLNGKMSGFALPAVPVTLKGNASADLSSESAQVPALAFALGDAVVFSTTVDAHQILHDPLIKLRNTKLAVDLGTATSWAPPEMIPATVRGKLVIDQLDVEGTQSALTAQQGFALALDAKLEHLNVRHTAATIERGAMHLTVATQPGADVGVKLVLALPSVTAGANQIDDIEVETEVTAPHEVLVQKLPKPLAVHASVRVAQVTAGANVVKGTTLDVAVTTKDLAGNDAHVVGDLGIASLHATVPGQGTFVYPIQSHFDLVRQGQRFRFDGTSLAVGDWLRVALGGRAELKPKGAIDTDVKVDVADIPLGVLLASLPSEAKKPLVGREIDGKLGASMKVSGVIPGDIATRFEGEPLDLAFAGTPFAFDFALRWRDLKSHDAAAKVDGAKGELSVSTRPQKLDVRFGLDAQKVDAGGSQIDDLKVTSKIVLADEHGTVDFAQTAASVQQATLASALTNVTSAAHIDYARGGDASLEYFRVDLPSLGAKLNVKGRVAEIDDFIEEKRYADKQLEGVEAELSTVFTMNAPSALRPLKDNPMSLQGQLGFNLDVNVKKSTVDAQGAFSSRDFSFEQPGLAVHKMSGRFPFAQALRFDEKGEPVPVLSDIDILRDNPRIAYYDELRSYRGEYGLTLGEVISGPNTISGIAFQARWDRGAFYVDHYAMALLNGDVKGQMAMALGNDKIARVAISSVFSNLDLSVMAKTTPGPNSQLSGTMTAALTLAEKSRNVDATFNLTQLGRDVLVAGLLALDPEQKDEKTAKNVKALQSNPITIKLLEATVRRNTLKAKLYYSFLLSTLTLGIYKPVPENLLGDDGTPIKPYIDKNLAPLSRALAPILRWTITDPRDEP